MTHAQVPRPCACTSIRKAARVLARTYDAALAPAGMTVTQLAVMRAILRHPDESLSRVAEELAMDRTSLYRAMAALRKQRWLRLGDGKDNRSRTAAVTKRGQVALSQADPGWSSVQSNIVDRFGHSAWQVFARELQRLVACAAEARATESASGRRA